MGNTMYSDLSCTMVVVPCEPISIKDKLEFAETILRIIKMVSEFGQSDIAKSISDWIIDFISNLWAKKISIYHLALNRTKKLIYKYLF